MCIYLVINLITGLGYVGKTIKTATERWKRHVSYSKHYKQTRIPFAQAIQKYGPDNFSICILEDVSDKSVLDERETWWIDHMGTTDPSRGYNVYSRWEDYSTRGPILEKHPRVRKHRYFGVMPMGNAFRMTINYKGTNIVRHFESELEAAQVYDMLRCYFSKIRDAVTLNFPEQAVNYTESQLLECYEKYKSRNKSSQYKGLQHSGVKNEWVVSTRFQYKPVRTYTRYTSEREAAEAFDKITLYLRGKDYPHLNFPEKREEYLLEDLARHFTMTTTQWRRYSSSTRGISYDKTYKRWQAKCCGKRIGVFRDEESAKNALNAHRAQHLIAA